MIIEAGPYTLTHLGKVLIDHGPAVLGSLPQLAQGFHGPDALAPSTRVAVQLRLSKLLGCPVCRGLFPGLAKRAGLDDDAIAAALRGEGAALPAQAAAALAWVDSILRAGGEPHEVVEAAEALSVDQRDHLVAFTRLDLIIHSLGLTFLPHAWVVRAAAD